jgi:hypothetical protein
MRSLESILGYEAAERSPSGVGEEAAPGYSAARLQQIATALDVPVTFFYDGDGKAREVESLLFLDSAFSLRLLRAYAKIKDQTVQRQLVSLMESIAANEA